MKNTNLKHTEIDNDGLRISAIMPVYNGTEFLKKSLPPLLTMAQRGEVLEVIVVDDGSTDESARVAKTLGAKVLSTGGRNGAGAARNLAATQAKGSILWFVDADVVVHEDAAGIVASGFSNPEVVAVFGSYDDSPPADNFFSQYKNLVHHYYHQHAKKEAFTFWAGCGAVRKTAFFEVGGFDAKRFKLPSIEDIELGYRLRNKGGRIQLLTELQGKHLKVWRLYDLIYTEIFQRALPWSRLMLETSGLADDLNVSIGERFRAVLAGLFLCSLIATVWNIIPWWALIVIFLVIYIANLELTKLFFRRRGFLFSAGGLLFHQIYYLYSSSAFAWCCFENRIARCFSK